ncbi:MAG: HipA family kinase [Ilyomonas sp.]
MSKQLFESDIRTVDVTRYVTPLREGGSLPAIAEADDGFMYVLKFSGAGQGVKALIAELIAGEIARVLGLKVPEIVFAHLDPAFGRTEPDEEIQDLLKASTGLNLALHYLAGAITFDPAVTTIDEKLASEIVWFDCFITNVDRTVRNTNMLIWHNELWLIDHGASLYFHHSGQNWQEQALKPFVQVKDHVLLPQASKIDEADAKFRSVLNEEKLRAIVELIPDEWLLKDTTVDAAEEQRQVYYKFLTTRLKASDIFVKEAKHAREAII